MDYESMLKKGKSELPENVIERDRFEIPKVNGHLQGNKTLISNFLSITSILHREPAHVLKYLLKELATSGELKRNVLVFNSKISAKAINNKIRQYTNTFVLCGNCAKPDTKMITEKGILHLKCQACGHKATIRY